MGSLILFYIQTMKTTIILTFLVLFGHSTDLTDAAPANDEIAVETNGHPTPGPIQAKSLDIVTSESSDRNQCQDKASGCPTWTWACTNNQWKDWMAQTCPKTCGVCPGNNECAKIPSWMKSDIANRIVHVQDGAGQSAFVEKITLHESYNPNTINNDIAILRLKTPLTFNDNVGRACLPEASFVPTGKAVASGWGLVAQFPDQSPKNLQWVTKPVVTNDKCCQSPFKWGVQQITANMICAGDADGGESTCSGDSGGPLVVPKSSTDDTAVVIGATSFGPRDGCGLQGLPAVYAYVTKYLDWIKPKIES